MSNNLKKSKYYNCFDDIDNYNAWCYAVWSRRGSGKTYSFLLGAYMRKQKFIYMKRTIDDVELICSANNAGFDPSPYSPINRDTGTEIKAISIRKGIGAFYQTVDGETVGEPIGYILAMNAVKRFKGFDFSDCDYICFDEFIPQIGERINHREGELLLDLYMTVARDRQLRGRAPLKLILFANAEEISTPITNTLEIVDNMANLNASGQSHYYDNDREILLHHITESEYPIAGAEKQGIYKGMLGTAWHNKSFGGTFANNDFSNVNRNNLKKMRCLYRIQYKSHYYYIYLNNNNSVYYMCSSRNKFERSYNLNRENEQKKFYNELLFELRSACIEERLKFEKYSQYDLIMNYKNFFKL